jgi:iron complex outermembrane receptor protein
LKPNQRLNRAIAAILSAHSVAALAQTSTETAALSPSDATSGTSGLGEIVVTAQRRAENLQDVPITIQVLTGETLAQLNVQTFDQMLKSIPNVTQFTSGPSTGEVYMRGLSIGNYGTIGAGSTHPFPSVAIYLDEQSGQLPGRNLDVYAADMERIEVLEGPQGTLFGGGALSGVLRYITNKPKINVTEGSADTAYSVTAHGDPSTSATAMLNLPLVDDHLAVRGVVYVDHRGGYIDNVPATFTRASTDLGFATYNSGVVPTNSVAINNSASVGRATNPVTYTGVRAELLWKVNDDWDALLSQTYQNMDAEGVFYEMPYSSDGTYFSSVTGNPTGTKPLPPLSVTTFTPSYDKDKFENTALVVNGRIGDLRLVYSGAYLVRNVDQQQDYTNYARGYAGSYYQCVGYTANPHTGQCYTPAGTLNEQEKNEHLTQELRLTTPDKWRVRGTAGVYWENYTIYDFTQFNDVTVPTCSPTGLNVNCFLPLEPWPGSPPVTLITPDGFFDDIKREVKQIAEFASVDFDVIPQVLTFTGGIRHFHYTDSETGGDVGPYSCFQSTPTTYFGPCASLEGTNLSARSPNTVTPSGNRGRAGITWKVADKVLLYYTYSQGFRAGTFNRSTTCHLPGPDGVPQYCIPSATVPDNVTNNEVGLKSQWLDNRLTFNLAVYQEYWDNAQVRFFDPKSFGGLAFGSNGPTYRVRGLEPQIIASPVEGLTVQASGAWNSSSQMNSPYLVDNNPASVNYGKPITSAPNPYGPIGSSTAYSPPFSFTARVRYEHPFGDDARGFVQVGAQHQDHMLTVAGNALTITGISNGAPYSIPSFTTFDAAIGVSRGLWNVSLFGQNITNSGAVTSIDIGNYVLSQVPLRPRVLGLSFGYRFSDKK